MLKGQMLMETLQEFVGSHRIEDLPIPLTIVASDVLARKEVWLNRGDLFNAIRASIAVPTVFTPHTIKGRPLLDGGVLNPVPIAPTLQDSTDAIIAVSLSGVEKRMGERSRRSPKPKSSEKPRHRYQKQIEAFIDQLQERLGFGSEREENEPSLSLTDAALLCLDAMQASIAPVSYTHLTLPTIILPCRSRWWPGR